MFSLNYRRQCEFQMNKYKQNMNCSFRALYFTINYQWWASWSRTYKDLYGGNWRKRVRNVNIQKSLLLSSLSVKSSQFWIWLKICVLLWLHMHILICGSSGGTRPQDLLQDCGLWSWWFGGVLSGEHLCVESFKVGQLVHRQPPHCAWQGEEQDIMAWKPKQLGVPLSRSLLLPFWPLWSSSATIIPWLYRWGSFLDRT